MAENSVVGIATRYRLDGTEFETRSEKDFLHPTRAVQGPTQPPILWPAVLSRGKAAGV
jgi:hypothetical protein